jgi:asparaginyl-tRNA synthetase
LQYILIKNLSEFTGEEVTLRGWLYNKRSSGKVKFIILRDGTGLLQCIYFKGNVTDEIFDLADRLGQESSIEVMGKVKVEPRAPGGFELDATGLTLISEAHDYPITPKEHGVEFLMDHRHLWLRSSKQTAILRIRHRIIKAIRDYFDGNGFTLMDPPILTPAACEGTSTLFETPYFDLGKAYLTQSGQLYAEAGAMAFGKVYTFGPTFRAEKSKTRRHLTEFWMVEPEVAFAGLNEDLDLAEDFLEYVVQTVIKDKEEELRIIERDTNHLINIKKPLPRITYDEAVEILKKNGIDFEWGNDLGAADETIISNQYEKPVMVHHYPSIVKAFYMKHDPNNDRLALAVDVLAPEGYGEIIGGSQREDDYDILLQRIKEHNLPQEAFEWYLDLRRYGSVPHSGETIPFPRMIYRNTP